MVIGVDFRIFSGSIYIQPRGRRMQTQVGRSLSCCNDESVEVLRLQSAVLAATSNVRNRHAELREVLRCQAVQALTPSCTV